MKRIWNWWLDISIEVKNQRKDRVNWFCPMIFFLQISFFFWGLQRIVTVSLNNSFPQECEKKKKIWYAFFKSLFLKREKCMMKYAFTAQAPLKNTKNKRTKNTLIWNQGYLLRILSDDEYHSWIAIICRPRVVFFNHWAQSSFLSKVSFVTWYLGRKRGYSSAFWPTFL